MTLRHKVWRLSRTAAACAMLLLNTLDRAEACPACQATDMPKLTLVQSLIDSDQVVVADNTGNPKTYRVQSVIKGTIEPGHIIALLTADIPWNGTPRVMPFILSRHAFTKQWGIVGNIGAGHEAWLQQIAVMKRTTQLTEQDWEERVRFFFGYLGNAEPIIDVTAFEEIRRSPYSAMLGLKPQLEADRLITLMSSATDRLPLYTLLLGIAGGDAGHAHIAKMLAKSYAGHEVDNLAALMTASMQIKGSQGLEQLRDRYIRNSDRYSDEKLALITALGVQGEAGRAITRDTVVETYREILKKHRELAGYVAVQLTRWKHWDMAEDFAPMLSKGISDPATEFAVLNYMRMNPLPAAKEAVARFDRRHHVKAPG